MATITFDFDNTIAMSHMDLKSKDVKYVFDGYNNKVIQLIQNYISKGEDVHIVTSRFEDKEGMFPDDTVEKHLEKLALSAYFWPDKVHYTNGAGKREKLEELGSTLHYDDDMQEHIDNFGGISVKNPYDFYKDTEIVGKVVIYDSNDKVLLLRRSDDDKAWDIPGGHLKDIEVERGKSGLEDGLEREVAEETGLILPFSELIGTQNFTWKGRTNKINIYLSKLEESEPNINLELQDYMENSEFRWVSMDEIFKFAKNGTQILRKAIELAKKRGILTEKQAWYKRRLKKDVKNRKKLIGLGGNKHTGGGKGHKRPKMRSPKSAPPGVGVLEEENEEEKRTIKVKIVQKVDEKRKKKRKKHRKKAKKGPKSAYYGGYFPHYWGEFGDNGGDGGGGE